jgi:CTP:molybdopterin cytidylyltransferase MocA
MGFQKLLVFFRGRPLLDHAIAAAAPWHPLVVSGPLVTEALADRADIEVVRNEECNRGMTHSLKLADRAVPPGLSLIVLLGDKPLITSELIARLCAEASGADVVYPIRPQTDEPGHPVVFSPRARAKIDTLPDGDSLRRLRDDPSLISRSVVTDDEAAFYDVDTVAQLVAARAVLPRET